MNEFLFVIHCLMVIGLMLGALKLGKTALMTYVSACWVLANFFVTKQILLFGYEITASDVYAIGAILGTSILQELWGKKTAIQSIWISFFILCTSVVMSLLHLMYTPSPHDVMHPHFEVLLHSTPRLVVASLSSFFLTGRLEVLLLSQIERFQTLPFSVRSGIVSTIVMLFDTVCFTLLGLYGIVSSFVDICIISSAIKLSLVLIMTPFLSFTKSFAPVTEL